MKTKRDLRILALRELLSTQGNHWAFFPALLLFAETSRPGFFMLLGWILLSFFPMVVFWGRVYYQSLWLQIAALPVAAVILFFLPIDPPYLKVVFWLFTMVYLFLSLFLTLRKEEEAKVMAPPLVPLIVNLLISMIAVLATGIPFTFYMHASAIFCVACSILAFYVDRYRIFVLANEGISSNMPKEKIFRSGMVTSLKYLGVVSAILILIASFSVSDRFFQTVRGWIGSLLKKALAKFLGLFSFGEPVKSLPQGTDLGPEAFLPEPRRSSSFFWRFLEVVVFAAMLLLLGYAFVCILCAIFRFFSSHRGSKVVLESEEETEDLDRHEDLTKSETAVQEEDDDRFLSPSRRIRRLYQKKAKASRKEGSVLSRMTAREFATQESNPDLAYFYEKARYSKFICTNEDVKQMQVAYRRKRKK